MSVWKCLTSTLLIYNSIFHREEPNIQIKPNSQCIFLRYNCISLITVAKPPIKYFTITTYKDKKKLDNFDTKVPKHMISFDRAARWWCKMFA